MEMNEKNYLFVRLNIAESALQEAKARIKLRELFENRDKNPDYDRDDFEFKWNELKSDIFYYEWETKRYRDLHERFNKWFEFYISLP